jgi:hypothetical protein
MHVGVSTLLLVIAIVLFLFAGIILVGAGSVGVAPSALIAFGLASFAGAHLS